MERLRIVASALALAGYGLCYCAAGALFAWGSFLFVALWFEWEAGVVSNCWEAASIVGGFLVAAWLAWRAQGNPIAHLSLLVVGVTQAIASGAFVARFALHSNDSFESGLIIGGAFWFGATAWIAAAGGLFGLVAQVLGDFAAPVPSSPTMPITRAA